MKKMPEEDAFCVLVQLMKEYQFRDLYNPKLVGLQMRMYQFDKVFYSCICIFM